MKKNSILALTLFMLSGSLFAKIDTIHFDGRLAAFFPIGETFKQIYGSCVVDFEFEIGKIFLKNYEIWANVDGLSTTGHTKSFHTKTRFQTVNTSLGAKYIFQLPRSSSFYLGLGINEAYVRVHNNSPYVQRKVIKNGVGGVVKLGFYFEPVEHLFIDLFADYLYQKINFENSIQVGGVKLGGGIGLCF